MTAFTKQCPTAQAAEREASGLAWLACADGGPRVAEVLGRSGAELTLERIATAAPSPLAARRLGAALARMHAAGAPGWGAPPPGTSGPGTIGMAPLATPASPGPARWGEFYARYRLQPHLDSAVVRGSVNPRDHDAIAVVIDALLAGDLDHPQPALLAPDAPARLHGDLWNGNVLWSDAGEVVLIDPAAHGGHAETDLAMLDLFGAPHLGEILAGYQEVSPLAAGWRNRVALHQLHPLLVHAELFGGGYGAEAASAARRALR